MVMQLIYIFHNTSISHDPYLLTLGLFDFILNAV